MSGSAEEGKPQGVGMVIDNAERIGTVLDVGAGGGIWQRLLAPWLPGAHWTAVEVWAPYALAHELADRYDRLIVGDVADIDLGDVAYDLVVMGDVLEHFDHDRAVTVTDRLLAHSRMLLISTPIIDWPQDEVDGNPWMAHRSAWTADTVAARWDVAASWSGQSIGVFLLKGAHWHD